jgi:hypothetical protein
VVREVIGILEGSVVGGRMWNEGQEEHAHFVLPLAAKLKVALGPLGEKKIDEEDWPFKRIALTDRARAALNVIWTDLMGRRPFKHDFPDFYERLPEDFDAMMEKWARAIDG